MEPRGVLVAGETAEGRLSLTTREVMAAGRRLADVLNEELAVALLGSGLEGPAREAFSFGADKVYAVANPLLEEFQAALHLAALEKLCREVAPNILLMGPHPHREGPGSQAGLSPGRRSCPGLPRSVD